jgi:hypothetical protein
MAGGRSDKLRRLAWALSEQYGLGTREQIEPQYDGRTREWTFCWVDGPTVEQVKRAARKEQPEAVEGLRYERRFSSAAVALGAVRLLRSGTLEKDQYGAVYFSDMTVREALRLVPHPRPGDERERLLVEAIVTEANGDHGTNWASEYAIVRLVRERGLAEFLRRSGAELSPIEALTARYVSSRGSAAWREQLEPMTALEAFAAVQADPGATPEQIKAALALVPRLHAELDLAAEALQARGAGPSAVASGSQR